MGVSLQNITFSTIAPDGVTSRIQVAFEYSDDKQQTWNPFSYDIPNDLFDIAVDEREQIAIELIMAIARGKGHIDEEGNVV
jgi:hypothetical protein